MELLVAMVIFAIMGAGMYTVFNSFQTAKQITDRESVRLGQLQRAFRFIGKDIQQMVARPVRDEFGSELRLPALKLGQDQFEFTRTGWSQPPFAERQRSELQRVQYVWEEGALKRFHWSVLDRAQDSGTEKLVLLEGVTAVSYKVFALNEQKQLAEFTEWPTVQQGMNSIPKEVCGITGQAEIALPLMVEVSVELEDLGKIARKFLVANGYEEAFFGPCAPQTN
jgi:general secretion pathway protein J